MIAVHQWAGCIRLSAGQGVERVPDDLADFCQTFAGRPRLLQQQFAYGADRNVGGAALSTVCNQQPQRVGHLDGQGGPAACEANRLFVNDDCVVDSAGRTMK